MDSYAPIFQPSLYTMLFGARQGAQRKKKRGKRGQRGGNPIRRYLNRKKAETLKKRRERFKHVQWQPKKRPRKKGDRQLERERQTGQGVGLGSLLQGAVKVGVKLGRSPQYQRMGALGATGVYKRHPRPWVK